MTIKSKLCSAFLVAWSISSLGQSFTDEMKFVRHLESLGQYEEAVFYLDRIKNTYRASAQSDSILYFKGRYLYEQKKIPSSIDAFSGVSRRSPYLWEVSTFFKSFQLAYQKDYDAAQQDLHTLMPRDSLLHELKFFELAGISLLKRDFESFDTFSNHFSDQYFKLSDYEEDLTGIADDIRSRKNKSPWVAGLMSAIIPGSGKYYMGQIGQGTMALVSTGIMGLQAYEGYRKDGPKSARFIIFGSLFTVFYTANIWGSAVGVRITEMRYNDSADEAILINMHLPIRVLFR